MDSNGIILGVLLFSLTGCGGLSYRTITRDLTADTGKDIHVVIQKIGYPTSQAVIAGDKVYAWENNGCTVHVGVDASEHITHFDYQGSHSDCERLANRLDD